MCLDLEFSWEKTVKNIVWKLKGAGLINTIKLGGKKKLKDLVPYFTKYSKSVLRNILVNSQDTKAPALSFSDLETELQTGPEEPMRGCLMSWLLFSVSSFWSQQAPSEGGTSAHVTAVLQAEQGGQPAQKS